MDIDFEDRKNLPPPLPASQVLPLLPLRDIVVFPHMVIPLFVGREKSIRALEASMRLNKELMLSAQFKAKTADPTPDEIFRVGSFATIMQLLRLPDGTVKVLVEGKRRARIRKFLSSEPYFKVEAEEIRERTTWSNETEALVRAVNGAFSSYVKLNKKIPPEMIHEVAAIEDAARLADTVAAHLNLKLKDKQTLLELVDVQQRLQKLYELMQGEIEILEIERKIRSRVKKQMERAQKEYYLNEQMQAIQKELGEKDDHRAELQELEERLKNKKMSEEATEKVKKELRKLKLMSPMSAEATVVRNYVDWMLSLPWYEYKEEKLDIEEAEKILDEDHYGLEKPKQRILEYLAVNALSKKLKGPILCFVGPPGVGKTSLARSIARATGRDFVRLSLGGVRDEAEIRGHRRTYIGALPGKIIQHMKKAGSGNPVFLLDEVDKMSSDFRGDPSAALLEVLDPEQNHSFNDHYLDVDYDLSRVMFITTANTLPGIPLPLQDRMEIIRLPGYTDYEKLAIAKKFLVPKQIRENGLEGVDITFSDSAIKRIMDEYTREAGVRNLEREIASVLRKVAKRVVKEGRGIKVRITASSIPRYLGVPKYRRSQLEDEDKVGLTNGLAWTEFGGELLQTEVTTMPGKGKLIITGKLGEVMQESAQAAMSYVRSRAEAFGIDPKFYEHLDVHIHVPEGATPKDGPSAGITMATSLVSALTGIPVRRDVAMTGEITLRGRVLPVGGLKEKIIAAHRAKVSEVILPEDNAKELSEVPQAIRSTLVFRPVCHMDEVLRFALKLDEEHTLFKRPVQSEGCLLDDDEQKPTVDEAEDNMGEQDSPADGESPTVT
ncbi:MAG: endopeptidase La [Deltaproteobacteria bacterium]|nr:MAG: endopeptidase La [Deltaproteobacteria bacterium]